MDDVQTVNLETCPLCQCHITQPTWGDCPHCNGWDEPLSGEPPLSEHGCTCSAD